MVPRHTILYPHRGFEIIVTPLQTSTQPIVVGQREDTLQVCHRATLVALQLFVIREIGIIGRELTLRVITVSQGDGSEIVIVSVTIPVYIKRQVVCFVEFPYTACCQTLVTVLHIVGLHVNGSILATRTVDTFPIGTALGIEFQILQRLVGQTLRNLPVGMAVHRHIARVFYQEFRLARIFRCRILPTV